MTRRLLLPAAPLTGRSGALGHTRLMNDVSHRELSSAHAAGQRGYSGKCAGHGRGRFSFVTRADAQRRRAADYELKPSLGRDPDIDLSATKQLDRAERQLTARQPHRVASIS
jgi:hypothetical protein